MTASTLLETLQSRGVTVRADGGTLRIKPFRLARDLDAAIRDNKPELLELLTGGTQSTLHTPDSADEWSAPRIAEKLGISSETVIRDLDSVSTFVDTDGNARSIGSDAEAVSANAETDRVIGADGLLRCDGFIVPTRETMPAYAKYFAARSTSASIGGSLSEIEQSTLLKSADNCRARWLRALARGDQTKAAQWREVYESHLAALMAENEAQAEREAAQSTLAEASAINGGTISTIKTEGEPAQSLEVNS
jgi:hypothetical protein